MGTAVVTVTRDKTIFGGMPGDTTEHGQQYWGSFTVSAAADTYATNGLTFSLAGIVPHTEAPVEVLVWSEGVDGYGYVFQRGTTIANGKLLIMASCTVVNGTGPISVEMTNGTAIPAVISSATKLRWWGIWPKGR